MADPTFDFEKETRAEWRIRQRDDVYPHEIFTNPPYDGVLVSKAIVDGNGKGTGRYTLAQQQRFWRTGVRRFFRLHDSLQTMGDCGAFSYVREKYPPITPDTVVNFYEQAGFDYGISVDHVILGFRSQLDGQFPEFAQVPDEWITRQEVTVTLAEEFLQLCQTQKVSFTPMGVAQGWSPESYTSAVKQLQDMGYTNVALGGMVSLKTHEILQSLEAISAVRNPNTRLHLLGVTRHEHASHFNKLGVTSFDSTSPLRQAFKDDKDNYYTNEQNYLAIRVPQVEGNPKLQARIGSGELNQEAVSQLEQQCIRALMDYDQERMSLDDTLEHVLAYEKVHHPKKDQSSAYRQVLEDRPWSSCPCEICKSIGVHVILFRGAERNKRRGFHNLQIFYNQIQQKILPQVGQ